MSEFMTPELLSPAGSLEKLRVAVLYGADAVYLGGQKFGLRSAADNFSHQELLEGVTFAHAHGTKVYVVLNSFLYDEDLAELPEFLDLLQTYGVDAVIVSDLGVVETVRRACQIPIHLSTQASCLNSYAAKFWREMGVTRLVLGREVTLSEAKKIKEQTKLEIEMFIHGSLCMSYSGNCVISNYTQGRDSNRGGCAHSCRFEYSLSDEKEKENLNSFFMSSKDLEGVRLIAEFAAAGIDSVKIEGRMKSHHYAGTVSKVYREALDFYKNNGNFETPQIYFWEQELRKLAHRDYTQASLLSAADNDSIFDERDHSEQEYVVIGIVREVIDQDWMVLEVRAHFGPQDTLELMPHTGATIEIFLPEILTLNNEKILKTRPSTLVKMPFVVGAAPWTILRKRVYVTESETTISDVSGERDTAHAP
jgi:putative protease